MSARVIPFRQTTARDVQGADVERHALTSASMSVVEMAALLRGEARDDDGAAVNLFGRFGLTPALTLALLPEARRIARQITGARQ